ncbi:MAG: phosphoribosylanthranilate isomerase [Cyclobacteriaceae bacterium]|nr:phosphoribosylanthranilate isomerase [Cyclobacteriaceae bacterium]
MNHLSSVRWKVCGMRHAANMQEVARLAPDYMGFIFYEGSPRFVGKDFFIPDDFPAGVKRVGVFVNAAPGKMLRMVHKHRLDFVQLHGDEPVSVVQNLKAEGVKTIKVFRVDEQFNFSVTEAYRQSSDFFLFDTKGKHYGGNAVQFDWSLLQQYTGVVPFFLSGGISVQSLNDLRGLKHPQLHAIDMNSGVETEPGLKDVKKLNDLIESVSRLNI